MKYPEHVIKELHEYYDFCFEKAMLNKDYEMMKYYQSMKNKTPKTT